MNIICRLIGHKVSEDYTDSGTYICERCGSHEYYDFEKGMWNKYPLLFVPKNKILRFINKYKEFKNRNELPF